jgi:hypothetical protein
MSQFDRLVSQLFRRPGLAHSGSRQLLTRAATAHATLLHRAAIDSTDRDDMPGLLPAALLSLVEHEPNRGLRRQFLLDPAFIEGLHAAAGLSPSLAAWHTQIAEPSIATVFPASTPEHAHRLGNSVLALAMRANPNWQGSISLRTDLYGRLRFPLSDWTIELGRFDERPTAVLADEAIKATLSRREVRFAAGRDSEQDLLVIPRLDWLRMLVGNDGAIDGRGIAFAQSGVSARLHFAGKIPGWHVRYEPIAFADPGHAGLTGGLASAILNAIRRKSASIASEFDSVLSVVRGWELPPAAYGTIQSFSDPTLPRVMGLNVSYGADDEPQIDPFCFTWFGHELGHTKSYLIETILHVLGLSLTPTHGGYTEIVARYARRLPIRTLLQIPYTHLYEWALLIDLFEKGFADLPWTIAADPIAFGDDLYAEIEEAFDLISREVEPTACGHSVLARLWALSKEILTRWQHVCSGRGLAALEGRGQRGAGRESKKPPSRRVPAIEAGQLTEPRPLRPGN